MADINLNMYMPEEVQRYIAYFHKKFTEGNVYECQSLYDSHFQKLTEQYYQKTQWPSSDIIRHIVGDDGMFLTLYNELWFRHTYGHLTPSFEHRVSSWKNYLTLFRYLLDSPSPISLQLPSQWLWDMIDEFVYQFLSFSQYKMRSSKRTEEETRALLTAEDVWHPKTVLELLYSFVAKSKIAQVLELERDGREPTIEQFQGDEFPLSPLYRSLGYFSIIGLLRMHVMFGDYHTALRVMEPIDISDRKGYYTTIMPCFVSVHYYVGFAYLMLRRYLDAVRSFTNVLSLYLRTKGSAPHGYQSDDTAKKAEQLFELLGIALTLCPMKIDETVQNALVEKQHERLYRIQKGDKDAEDTYREMFLHACPKFVSPCPTDYLRATPERDMTMKQMNIFLHEVLQQSSLPVLRSYLRLYTTIPVAKLAKYIQIEPERLEEFLLRFKHKVRALVNMGGKSVLSGEHQSTSDIDFVLEKDVIRVVPEVKSTHRLGDQFLLQIMKLDDTME